MEQNKLDRIAIKALELYKKNCDPTFRAQEYFIESIKDAIESIENREMDKPKQNNCIICYYCNDDDKTCIGFIKNDSGLCSNKGIMGICKSSVCIVNRLVIELSKHGIKVTENA